MSPACVPVQARASAVEESLRSRHGVDGKLLGERDDGVRTGIERRGLAVGTVSTGGTPTIWHSGELRPLVTEFAVRGGEIAARWTVERGR
jgi:hypothetical protein